MDAVEPGPFFAAQASEAGLAATEAIAGSATTDGAAEGDDNDLAELGEDPATVHTVGAPGLDNLKRGDLADRTRVGQRYDDRRLFSIDLCRQQHQWSQ